MAASYRDEGSLLSQDSIFGSHSFKSRQYRVKEAEYGQLVKSSADAEESQKYQDLEGSFVASAVILTATDTLGAISTQTFVATPTSFLGFVSTGAIATLVFSTSQPGSFVFPAVDNLTIAMARVTPIPEPHTWSLFLAGLAVLGYCARRSRSA